MIKLSFSRPLIALTLLALFGATAAQAAPSPPVVKSPAALFKSSLPTVAVQTGEAILEEYHDGDPGTRTTILRAGETACRAKTTDSSKKHS